MFVGAAPVMAAFAGSRRDLFARLGLVIYLLIGLQWRLSSIWMAASFRRVHSMEVLVDAFVYMGVLVRLFTSIGLKRETSVSAAGS